MAHLFLFGNINNGRSIIPKDLAEPILGAILDDDSDKLAELASNLEDIDCTLFIFDKKLPDIISQQPTMLSLCCFFTSSKCFNLLLNMNANPSTVDKFGRKCIHFVAAGGSLDLMRILDQSMIFDKPNDANVNEEEEGDNDDYSSDDDSYDDKQNDPWSNFIFPPNQANQKKSSIRNKYDEADLNGLTPMHYAAMFGRLSIIRYLWTKGAKIDKYKDSRGNKPIHLACLYGHTESVRFLLENGKKSQSKSSHKLQPIHYACIGGFTGTIDYLISQGADINALANSKTPIFYAARYGSLEAVKLLVKHGAKFKFKRRKTSPIVEAALGGHADIVNYFLRQGCDPNIYTSNGMTPLIAAVSGNNSDIVKLLIQNGAKLSNKTLKSVRGKEKYEQCYDKKTKSQLFKEIVQINNFSDWDCNDPLIMASRKADINIFSLILDQIDIDEFIQEDEEITRKKNAINRCLLKIFEEERKHNRLWQRFQSRLFHEDDKKSKKSKTNDKIKNTFFIEDSTNIKDNENKKISNKRSMNNDDDNNNNEIKKDENPNTKENEDKSTYNSCNDTTKSRDTNLNKDDNDVENIENDREVYRKVVSLGHSSYTDLIENDMFFNPHFGKRYHICLNAIKLGSVEFLELLIKNRIYPTDATELYSTAPVICCKEILNCMLNNDIPFDKTNMDLKKFVLSMGDIEILKSFLEKGLHFDYEKDIAFISNVFRTYNPDFLSFVLDNVFIKKDKVSEEKKFNDTKQDSFLPLFYQIFDLENKGSQFSDFINILLDNSFHSLRYNNIFFRTKDEIFGLDPALNRKDFMSKSSKKDYRIKIEEKMMSMINILLDRGHKFNPNGRMFSIPTSAHPSEINLLFELLKEIEKKSTEIDFKNLQLFNLRPIFDFGINKHRDFIEFLFTHNFSLKPRPNDPYHIQRRSIEEIDKLFANAVQIGFYRKSIRMTLRRMLFNSFLLNKKAYHHYKLNNSSKDSSDDDDDDDDDDDEENNNEVNTEKPEEEEERKSYVDLVWFLLKNDTPVSNSSLRMIEKAAKINKDTELASLAFKNYYNLEKLVEYGHKTPLELACKRGYLDIVKDLVARGFDVNESGYRDYASPLLFAKMSKNEELINFLESVGAKPPKLNKDYSTELYKNNNEILNFMDAIFM